MRNILIIFLVMFAASCGDAENKESTEPTSADSAQATPTITASDCNCFRKILQRDTMVAAIINIGDSVTGRLNFDNFEKDGSSGTVHGRQDGDIIKLWYNFASEGTNSVMEVYFKKDGNQLVRGIGDIGTKGDTAYFTKPGSIQYDDKQAYEKLPCDSLLPKYRCDTN